MDNRCSRSIPEGIERFVNFYRKECLYYHEASQKELKVYLSVVNIPSYHLIEASQKELKVKSNLFSVQSWTAEASQKELKVNNALRRRLSLRIRSIPEGIES